MKFFALIVALLIWLLGAFGCAPATPKDGQVEADQTQQITTLPTIQPVQTAKPAGDTSSESGKKRSSSSHHSDGDDDSGYVAPTKPSTPDSEREDTLMPEIGDDDSGSSGESGNSGSESGGREDTLLPEI